MCVTVLLKFAEFKLVLDQQTTYYEDKFLLHTEVWVIWAVGGGDINISEPNVIQKS